MPAVLLDNLTITDGTDTVRFMSASLLLQAWRPAVGGLRGNGTWRTPLFDDGSSLVMAQYDDITDVFEVAVPPTTEDGTYARIMDLFALLEKARHYWISSYASEPVWIEAQGPDETERRHAVIRDWRIPGLGRGPFDQEFTECISDPNQTVQLTLVHGLWQSTPPLEPECLELSATQGFEPPSAEQEFVPTAQNEDGYAWDTGTTMDIASNWLRIGNQGVGILETAIRFNNVTLPPGAQITDAFIRFRASANLAGATVNCMLKGERNSAPAIFQAGIPGYNDMKGRFRTLARVHWRNIPAWVAGTDYDTPDISPIVQEIVDLGTWASGNNLVIFVDDHPWSPSTANAYRQARSWDMGANPPTLHVYYNSGNEYGREETCEAECYVVNKHADNQLTHVYHYDASGVVWSGNLMTLGVPFNLLPNPIQNNDAIYFGIDVTHPQAGPFSNLVFDIGTATVYSDLGAACSVTWQYWNGAWVNLTVCDNTSYGTFADEHPADHPFRKTGVDSVHWVQPLDWITTTVGPGAGTTGWWVRGLVAIGGGESIAPVPTQQNRLVYTCTWPYVDIADDVVDGDVPALLKVLQLGKSDYPETLGPTTWETDRYIHRVLLALRSENRSRGVFSPYLNAGDITSNRYWREIGANTAYAIDSGSPTGTIDRVNYAAATAALAMESAWELYQPRRWYGRYRAYLRYIRTAGNDGDIRVQLRITTESDKTAARGAIWRSEERDLPIVNNELLLHDFGLITLPPGMSDPARSGTPSGLLAAEGIRLEVWLQNTAAGARVVDIYDLIIMPADEWLVEIHAPINLYTNWPDTAAIQYTQNLTADSTRPKVPLNGVLYDADWDDVYLSAWVSHNIGRILAHPRQHQRLWWLMARADDPAVTYNPYSWRPEHEMSMAIRAEMARRYLAVRGKR